MHVKFERFDFKMDVFVGFIVFLFSLKFYIDTWLIALCLVLKPGLTHSGYAVSMPTNEHDKYEWTAVFSP